METLISRRAEQVCSENPLGLLPGDTVRIQPYKSNTLHGYEITPSDSGSEGQITSVYRDYDWRSAPNFACIRIISGDTAWLTSRPLSQLDLVQQGCGYYELGVTHPFSKQELRQQRLDAFEERLRSFRGDWDGWSNAASQVAFMILSNDSHALDLVERIRRADGTVHPEKVRKIFVERGLKVEGWPLEPAIDVPDEFNHLIAIRGWNQTVNWDEVAINLSAKK